MKIVYFNVWVRSFVRIFKGTLWKFTQNILPIRWKMCILFPGGNLRALRFKSSEAFLKRPPRYFLQDLDQDFINCLRNGCQDSSMLGVLAIVYPRLDISKIFTCLTSKIMHFFLSTYIMCRREPCSNPLAWLVVLLAMGHQVPWDFRQWYMSYPDITSSQHYMAKIGLGQLNLALGKLNYIRFNNEGNFWVR